MTPSNQLPWSVCARLGGGPGPAAPGADFTGWQLARAFGASIHNHNVGGPGVVISAAADARNGNDWSDGTWETYCSQRGSFEALSGPEAFDSVVLDTELPKMEQANLILERLAYR